ncbi:MAG TPA: tetratricopeptide repeat protein [Terriglobia bacterium]|nr:tetratricopeptide repeat protein [Terriglobia bacterium]
MHRKLLQALGTALAAVVFVPGILWGQFGIPTTGRAPLGGELQNIERQTWHIFGKVTDLEGKPLREAKVRVDVGLGPKFVKELTTDVQGGFSTEYNLEADLNTSVSVNLLVNHDGFHPAHEFVNFGHGDKTWQIDVVMRPESADSDELPVESLIGKLAPKLRASLQQDSSIAPAHKDFERGADEFLDRHDSSKAIPSFNKVVKRYPSCANCLTMLGLAELDAGSWRGASSDIAEAAKLVSAQGSKQDQAESFLIVAEMENWKGEYAKAAGFLMKAKDLDPKNAFVLQELGRTLVLQKNWDAAVEYLQRALDAGAGKEALLLRTQALLEQGDAEAADASMKAYLGGDDIKTFPISVRRLYAQIDARKSLRSYLEVKSVVNEPLPSLVKGAPELHGLEPASGTEDVAAILKQAGENVQAFFNNFQNTMSVEQVREERLNKNGKVKDSLDQKFQYLLVTHPEKWGLGLEEFRTDMHGERAAPTGLSSGLMITSGFASASLLFHPAYQEGATFRYLGKQAVNGHDCFVVAFAQKPEKAQMVERFNMNDASILVLFQGLAWIDAQSYKVVRLRTDLLKPQTKIRLERQTTEITYDPVTFKQLSAAMWLPSEVAVTVEWQGKTYRNLHKYSDFKLFNTNTKEKVKQVDAPPQDPPQN